jgi:sua5/yciO/yrdC/ywlC family protein
MILKKSFGIVKLSDNLFKKVDNNTKVESPGMKYRHYAPNTKCVLIVDNEIEKINMLLENGDDILVLGFDEDKEYINTDKFLSIGSRKNLNLVSKNLFSNLRKIDSYNCEYAVIEGLEKVSLGLSIMNRLIRACENNVI